MLDIPDNGLVVWLKGYGYVKLFKTQLKEQLRHYVVYWPDEEKLALFDRAAFELEHGKHWQIEHYHRAIKQACNVARSFISGFVNGKENLKKLFFANCQCVTSTILNYCMTNSTPMASFVQLRQRY
ncbi:MAG: hypothetical protein ACNA7G_08490, partial [Methylobacter sp.]